MEYNKTLMIFLHEIIVGIVFLDGIWVRLGLYPGEETWSPILLQIYSLFPSSSLFWFLPFILLFISMLCSFFIAGWLGLLAITFAFLGGFLIRGFFGMLLLIAGLFIGLFAPLRE